MSNCANLMNSSASIQKIYFVRNMSYYRIAFDSNLMNMENLNPKLTFFGEFIFSCFS